MLPVRAALLVTALATVLPAGWRLAARRPRARPPCVWEGRGNRPRHWLGCAGDPGPRRELGGAERLALGLPIDPNRARADELALLPGISRRLAEAVVAEREAHGPFASVDDLLRVRGIGPAKLGAARPHLALGGGDGGGGSR